MEALLHGNIRKIYIISFFQSFLVVIPVFVPLLQGFGLSMTEVMQTQAIFALTVALCEVPSGYLADLWGRKNAILTGAWLTAAGYASLPWANTFNDFVAFEIVVGVGLSLSSGSDLALLYDTQAQLNRMPRRTQAAPGNHIARLVSLDTFAEASAAILASLLLLWALDLVVIAQALVGLVPAAFALGLVEPERQVSTAGHSDNLLRIVGILRRGPIIAATAMAIVVCGLAGIYAFWMYQKYWQLQGVDISHFGYLWAAYCLVASLTARFAGVIEHRLGTRGVLALVALLPIAGFTGMALGQGWIGIVFGLAFMMNRGLHTVVFYDALNRRLAADFRATINSLVSLGVRAVFIVSGPVLGYLVDTRGMATTLLLLAACFAPVLVTVLLLLYRQIGREARQERQCQTRLDAELEGT
jgi:MFS family permease